MDTKVLCDICSAKAAVATCKLCGRRVCESHFSKAEGICTSCKAGRKLK